ncbi:MAG TPA: hypothetical protein VEW03_14190, partial [Longimicrobiaceae bacterium]|nr:hypothetical protein [Longimicrobiaceae bacterium]
VCDAEQIVHCQLNVEDRFRLSYEGGSLENPKFNRLSLDVLEGTAFAFEARRTTYDPFDPHAGLAVELPVFEWPPSPPE